MCKFSCTTPVSDFYPPNTRVALRRGACVVAAAISMQTDRLPYFHLCTTRTCEVLRVGCNISILAHDQEGLPALGVRAYNRGLRAVEGSTCYCQ